MAYTKSLEAPVLSLKFEFEVPAELLVDLIPQMEIPSGVRVGDAV